MGLGGFLIRRYHLQLRGIVRLVLLNIILSAFLGSAAFFLRCEESSRAGLNVHYGFPLR
jgi:hypothetical protein